MDTTQNLLPIKNIQEDLVVLKDRSVALVIKTSAVNFGLLSEQEQLAIILSFAGFLNSLSFAVQIVIRSKRLDISSYLQKLDIAKERQNNSLLRDIMGRYRVFIESIIRENEVLDKQFYLVIPVSYLELGILSDEKKHFQKALTIMTPRRDHVIRQLERIGLKATQLNSEELTKLFYDIYNGSEEEGIEYLPSQKTETANQIVVNKKIAVNPQPEDTQKSQTTQPLEPVQPKDIVQPSVDIKPTITHSMPFIVEELPDEYSSV